MTALSTATLGSLGDRVPVPGYDRSAITTGIVHFGVGGFHRAHLSMYLDRLMSEGGPLDWGVCGTGVMPADRAAKEAVEAQDGLYTLVLKHADGTYEPRVIGTITEFLLADDDAEAVIEKMAAESTRIVSLTITEGGYFVENTTFDLIVQALERRRDRGQPPFTVLSCDNLEGNGDRVRAVVTEVAGHRDHELGRWIEREVTFPNSMVDRITPRTTDDDRDAIRERFGIEDRWPVVCEPFEQWVVEDAFVAGRPEFDRVGAQLVAEVEPYELMKLRLLNASHQALCYLAHLSGYRLVHEAAQDPLFERFLRDYMDAEGTPTLAAVPGVDLDDYKTTLIERFANPEIRDTIARLCTDGSHRIPPWLLPVVRRNLEDGGEVHRSAAVVAGWARYCQGTDEQGERIDIDDPNAEKLLALGARVRDEPLAFISDHELFGELAADDRFVEAYLKAIDSLHARGARATLESLVSGRPLGVEA